MSENMKKLLEYLKEQRKYCVDKSHELWPLEKAGLYRGYASEYRDWITELEALVIPKCPATPVQDGMPCLVCGVHHL